MRRIARTVALLACLAPLAWAASARATTLVPIGSFDAPIYVSSDPGDPDRLLVVEREGRVVVVEGPTRSVFADLESWVQCCEGERGLLSIAPAADFATSGRFYAAYTGVGATAGGATGDIHLDAFRSNPAGGDVPLREPILTIPHSSRDNHNGGQVQLGPDGHLYLSTGDGGGAGDPDENAQDPTSMLGKILRIDTAVPGGSPQIWASGLRNPWRFSFDRLTGTMAIGDVGQSLREEVDIGVAGANYGWNCREGFAAYPGAPGSCSLLTDYADPVFDYPHVTPGAGAICGGSIVGGYVVRDFGLGDLYGRYLYSDFCMGGLRSLSLPSSPAGLASGDRSEGLAVPQPVSFGEDACGRIYLVSQGGAVFRLQGDFGGGCFAGPPSAPSTVAVTTTPRPRPLVILQARRRSGRVVKLIVRVLPCGDNVGRPVYINRNGRLFRERRLGLRCATRLRVRIHGRTRFRAFFEGQRSQVRTIAFAKPRP